MTERDPGTTDLGPADDSELDDDEALEEEEPESEEEAEGETPAGAPAPAGGRRTLIGGRGRRGEAPATEVTRRTGSVRESHERVRVDDRASAIYSVVAAAALIGVLLFSLTLAPGGYFNPQVTPKPIPTVSTVPQFVSQPPGAPTPTPAPSGSTSAAPSTSATPAPTATPVPSAT